jgi:LytS/YehU family sensor histidine kinase
VLLRYAPSRDKYPFAGAVGIVLSWAVFHMTYPAYEYYGEGNAAYLQFLSKSVPIRIFVSSALAVVSGVVFIFHKRTKEMEESQQQLANIQSMVREAELQKLQLQLQPHFLFNSLNSINALIVVQPSRAREMVQQLSDFLRATLKRADEQWITLAQEADYLRLYLSIEKVRFGHRLEVQLNLDEQLLMWLIPPLLLQPLVENAIKFGLYGTTDNVTISMNIQREGNALQVEISNPFDADMQPSEGSGFGLSGLKRRLYLLYTRNDLLTTRTEGNQFFVRLTLPEK